MRLALLAAALLLVACPEKPKPSPPPVVKPVPLEPLLAARPPSADAGADGGEDRETAYQVRPFTPAGEAAPAGALRLEVAGESLKLGAEPVTRAALPGRLSPTTPMVLVFDAETYVAQVASLLALLDDAKVHVWLQSPEVPTLAWPVSLLDEPAFNAWIEEPVPGKLRIVQRTDGFELQTNMGKLPGADPKGPTVPLRGGAMDLVTLQLGLDQIKRRFHEAPDVCFLPSFGTTMQDATRALSTNWLAADKVVFAEVRLVYPRPKPPPKRPLEPR